MKLMRYFGFYCLMVIILLYLFPIGHTVAIDAEPRIDIATSAQNSRLFEVENLKPGDWAIKDITIENKGNKDFYYKMTAAYESGDELFYQALDLKVEYAGVALYDGKLSDFEGLSTRFLAATQEEDLKLSIKFPFEYDNNYQGLETDVVFIFTAEGEPDQPPGCEELGNCPEEPTCEELGNCPEEPNCEELGNCPEEPTCEELGNCPEEPNCEELGNCQEDPVCEGEDCPGPPEEEVPSEDPDQVDDSSEMVEETVGGELPKTSVPWYNLILLALAGLVISGAGLWILRKRETAKLG